MKFHIQTRLQTQKFYFIKFTDTFYILSIVQTVKNKSTRCKRTVKMLNNESSLYETLNKTLTINLTYCHILLTDNMKVRVSRGFMYNVLTPKKSSTEAKRNSCL